MSLNFILIKNSKINIIYKKNLKNSLFYKWCFKILYDF